MNSLSGHKKEVSQNIENHNTLKGFTLEQIRNEDSSEIGGVQVLSPIGEKLSPLEINFRIPDNINSQYQQEQISAEEVVKQLKKYQDGRKSLQQTLDRLGYEWAKSTYNSIHGQHNIHTLVPKSLNLNDEQNYDTNLTLSLSREYISYLGTFGDKSLFISPGIKFGDMSMRGFFQGIFVVAISEKLEMYTAYISGGDIMSEEDFGIYEYNGSLLLSISKRSLLKGRQDSLRVLVTTDGTLGEGLFHGGEIKIYEIKNYVGQVGEGILEILSLEGDK